METERLYIELASSYYSDDLYDDYHSSFVKQYNVLPDITLSSFKTQLDIEVPHEVQYVIISKAIDKAIGMIILEKDTLRYHNKTIQISYWINKMHSNQGLMKEALTQMIDYIFLETQIEMISARVFTQNNHSQKLLKSLRFIQDSIIKSVLINDDGTHIDEFTYTLRK